MPTDTPKATPVVVLIVATVGVLLDHVPPEIESLIVLEVPKHILTVTPDPNAVFTVTVLEAKQLPKVYVITAVPTVDPLTTPVVDTGATDELLLDQTPPVGADESVDVDPRQTAEFPVIGAGDVITVIFAVATHPLDRIYVTVVVPELTPLNTPDTVLIVPTAVLLLDHVPAVGVPERVTKEF